MDLRVQEIFFKEDHFSDIEIIKGTAIRILEIDKPKAFDLYYFVEKDENNKIDLERSIEEKFLNRKYFVVNEDCNNKLQSMVSFLQKNKNYRALVFIDPYGMSLNWKSIECLKGLGIDLWILVPTGIGVNRLLKKDGQISEAWLTRLEKSLGLTGKEILNYFYTSKTTQTLFGEETNIAKEKQATDKAAQLYVQRLNEIFDHVSESFALKNSTGSTMYHFMMATNNKAALKLANDVIKPKRK
jgi:three-Cys-motif partner protein